MRIHQLVEANRKFVVVWNGTDSMAYRVTLDQMRKLVDALGEPQRIAGDKMSKFFEILDTLDTSPHPDSGVYWFIDISGSTGIANTLDRLEGEVLT